MTQSTIPELAKQGEPEAIASLMNYLLQGKGITTKVAIKDACLLVTLTSAQVPDQQSSVAFARKVIVSLGVESIDSVKIYGKQVGQNPSWTESLDLTPKVEKPQKQTQPWKLGKLGNLKAIAAENLVWRRPTPKQLTTALLSLVLVCGLAAAIYFALKTPQAPLPIASQAPSTSPNPFRLAVNKAMIAAKLTQSAKSQEDWNLVATQWQEASDLMKAVPASSPKYAVAQKKVLEYLRNMDYASSAASRAK